MYTLNKKPIAFEDMLYNNSVLGDNFL